MDVTLIQPPPPIHCTMRTIIWSLRTAACTTHKQPCLCPGPNPREHCNRVTQRSIRHYATSHVCAWLHCTPPPRRAITPARCWFSPLPAFVLVEG